MRPPWHRRDPGRSRDSSIAIALPALGRLALRMSGRACSARSRAPTSRGSLLCARSISASVIRDTTPHSTPSTTRSWNSKGSLTEPSKLSPQTCRSVATSTSLTITRSALVHAASVGPAGSIACRHSAAAVRSSKGARRMRQGHRGDAHARQRCGQPFGKVPGLEISPAASRCATAGSAATASRVPPRETVKADRHRSTMRAASPRRRRLPARARAALWRTAFRRTVGGTRWQSVRDGRTRSGSRYRRCHRCFARLPTRS